MFALHAKIRPQEKPDDGDGETDDNNDDNEDDNVDNDDGYDGDVRPARKDSHCCQHSCQVQAPLSHVTATMMRKNRGAAGRLAIAEVMSSAFWSSGHVSANMIKYSNNWTQANSFPASAASTNSWFAV